MTDKNDLKPYILDYVLKNCDMVDTAKNPPMLQCPNPEHTDNKPSAVVYQKSNGDKTDSVYCPVCGESWDIYDVAKFITGSTEFPELLKHVKESINYIDSEPAPITPAPKKKQITVTPVTITEAKNIYKIAAVQDLGDHMNKGKGIGKFITHTPYKNADGEIILIEARFEENNKKTVTSIYWNGKHLQSSGYPICLYNRDKIIPGCKIMIHEGGKKAAHSENLLTDFIHLGWNGGAKKVKQIDWSFLAGHEVYLYPDDDHKTDKMGNEWPLYKQPGFIAMKYIYDKTKDICKTKIVTPLTEAQTIKPDGADIVEALEILSPDKLTDYILSAPNMTDTDTPLLGDTDPDGLPFKILGVADDGHAYFIDSDGRLQTASLDKLTRGKLMQLTSRDWWQEGYGEDGKLKPENWEIAINHIIRIGNKKDFDPDNIRGRGAWREPDGRICYHDGVETVGEFSAEKLFLRKIKKDIGLTQEPATPEICREIMETVNLMNFETEADAMRCLSWSILAPFSGALPIRPAGLLTGESGSGKTAILDRVIRPLSASFVINGKESSVAGLRQYLHNDSCGIAIEEVGEPGNDPKAAKIRNDYFSLMRISFSDDAPDAYKGTQDQTGKSFKMKNMFLFVSISSEVEEIADDKRIFFINIVHKKNDWPAIRAKTIKLMTDENCAAIRSKTWKNINKIIETSNIISPIIEDITNLDTRSSTSEAMLYAAHLIIWRGIDTINLNEIKTDLKKIYGMQQIEEHRNEVEEILDRLLDESVMIPKTFGAKKTLRQLLTAISTGMIVDIDAPETDLNAYKKISQNEMKIYKDILAAHGLAYSKSYEALAIQQNHHMIKKIIQRGTGYHKQFYRHPGLVKNKKGEKTITVSLSNTSRRCVLLKGVIPGVGGNHTDNIPF